MAPILGLDHSLIEEVRNGRASLFLGAGGSAEADLPTSTGLAADLAERAGPLLSPMLKDQPLDVVAQHLYMQKGYGRDWVRRQIISLLEQKQREIQRPPSAAHGLMTSIRWRTLFTTNYDRVIEIAYDSSATAVQRVLPVFTPDPLILRHEPDVVRLIKLNGSTDEAQRSASHELVLTFSEQQQARSKNRLFYDVLREEAINGPIIFVGFSFTHPGATMPGNSPEFMELQALLRELGPAARWHYCVCPYDPSNASARLMVSILESCQIQVINSALQPFLESLSKQILVAAIPLAQRPMVVVPVGSSNLTITADEYERDRRSFELLGSPHEALKPPSVADSLNGSDNWASVFSGHFIDRTCKAGFRAAIDNAISNSPEIIFFGAPAGWGKTTLLRQLSVEFHKSRRPVMWLNPLSTVDISVGENSSITLASWDKDRIDYLLGIMASLCQGQPAHAGTCIIIADECAERVPEVLSLYRTLTSTHREFVLILSVRDEDFKDLQDAHPPLRKARQYQPAGDYDSRDEVRALIEFCARLKVATFESAAEKALVEQRILEEEADSSLILALQIIFDHKHRPFGEIIKELWDSLPDDIAQTLVIRVAAWHRFGNKFAPRLFSLIQTFPPHLQSAVLSAYKLELDKKHLFEPLEEGEPCVSTMHSLVADKLAEVSGKRATEIDEELFTVVRVMTRNVQDIELLRKLSKRITDYDINLSSEDRLQEFFDIAAAATDNDWVICHQYAVYLLQRNEFELSFGWIERALAVNPHHGSLHHTRGNILRKWGMAKLAAKHTDADAKFQEARKCFALSRVKPDPDEFGYVTHLDMLISLVNLETDVSRKANYLAEGIDLYKAGLQGLTEDKFNLLLDPRFRLAFDLKGKPLVDLCKRIQDAIEKGRASVYACTFLADQRFGSGDYGGAIKLLEQQIARGDKGAALLVKAAEIHARGGQFLSAAKSIDSAKRREKESESVDVLWRLLYWDLLIAIARQDFDNAREASARLNASGFSTSNNFPRGYFWRSSARDVAAEQRTFVTHGMIYEGRIENIRPAGQYGEIRVSNAGGERYFVPFIQRYWSGNLRRGDYVKFVMTILPSRVRADDIKSKPFARTVDDLFV